MEKVLLTGGSGMIGEAITKILLDKGYRVAHLSTRKNYKRNGVETYYWNTDEGYIDKEALADTTAIFHLAGAGIADERWTPERKKIIIDSRVESSKLLRKALDEFPHNVKTFIGTSAIGYYGNQGNIVLTENSAPGSDFLAEVCKKWENSYTFLEEIRKVVIRVGVVLAKEGGALPKMTQTLPFFVGILGNGKQYYSWIHIDDLAQLFVHCFEQKNVSGTFNAVAPYPLPQKELAKTIAKYKKSIALPAPEFALEFALGEMKAIVLNSQRCCSKKIENTGYSFTYLNVKEAIKDLL